MNLKYISGIAAVAILALPMAVQAAVPVVQNGSFEQGADPGSFTPLSAGNTSITGWTIGGDSVDYIGSYWQAGDGLRSIDLSGNGPGSLSQVINDLIVGEYYTVGFLMAGNPDGGNATKVLVASDGGIQSQIFSFPVGGSTRSNMGWVAENFVFKAAATSATLTFASSENNPYGAALDDVSIRSGAVPEPATWAMMIAGFGMAGVSLRRRRTMLA